MTVYRNLNKAGTGGNFAAWWLKETLKSAGWTVPRSGSGIGGVFDTSDVFGSVEDGNNQSIGVGIGSETLGAGGCWFVMRDPAANREFMLFRGTITNINRDGWWGMDYSKGALFTGGDASTPATASDEVNLRGNAADSFTTGGTASITHVAADDTPNDRGEYGFICLNLKSPNYCQAAVLFDDLLQSAVGDGHALAVAFIVEGLGLVWAEMSTTALTTSKILTDVGGLGESFQTALWTTFCNNDDQYLPAFGQASKYDGKVRIFPTYVRDALGVDGFRGYSRWFRAPGVPNDYPNTADGKRYLYVDQVAIDMWDSLTVPGAI